jgi:hypothetical protein
MLCPLARGTTSGQPFVRIPSGKHTIAFEELWGKLEEQLVQRYKWANARFWEEEQLEFYKNCAFDFKEVLQSRIEKHRVSLRDSLSEFFSALLVRRSEREDAGEPVVFYEFAVEELGWVWSSRSGGVTEISNRIAVAFRVGSFSGFYDPIVQTDAFIWNCTDALLSIWDVCEKDTVCPLRAGFYRGRELCALGQEVSFRPFASF